MRKRGPRRLPRRERFEQRVDRSGGPDACHLWTLRPIRRGGYGHFYDDDGRVRRAHIVAWELENGPVPFGQVVRHKCDTPLCCNVQRCLILGTQADNMRDMDQRGRANRFPEGWEHGEQRYNAKLTEELVRNARAAHGAGESIASLAREAGVSEACMSAAIHRRAWRHVL